MTPFPSELWHVALIAALKQQHLDISKLSSNSYVKINHQVEVPKMNVDLRYRNINVLLWRWNNSGGRNSLKELP